MGKTLHLALLPMVWAAPNIVAVPVIGVCEWVNATANCKALWNGMEVLIMPKVQLPFTGR